MWDFALDLPTPNEMLGRHAGGDVDIKTALEYFSTPQPLEFDNLYPVYYSLNLLERERSFGSFTGIDDFIGALPVNQMYNVYFGVYENSTPALFHEYVMMLRWLKTSMEISSVTRNHLHDRMSFLNVYLRNTRAMLVDHVQHHLSMLADESLDEHTIYLHSKDGFHKERGYNIFVYLSMAMKVIDVLAHQADKLQWLQCGCTKCNYYRSPEWRENRPLTMAKATLAPKRFYRRGSTAVSPSEEIYRKQKQKKQKNKKK